MVRAVMGQSQAIPVASQLDLALGAAAFGAVAIGALATTSCECRVALEHPRGSSDVPAHAQFSEQSRRLF
jgi:hypothetical protein